MATVSQLLIDEGESMMRMLAIAHFAVLAGLLLLGGAARALRRPQPDAQ